MTRSTSSDLTERLAAAAYTRVDLVERRGEFAVRGGIVDVFPPTEEHPLRVELWGDTVEEVRWFKVADQRSLEVAEHGLWAPPCRELLLTDAVRERAAELAVDAPRARRRARQARRGHRGRGHGVARAGARRRAWCCCSTSCRPARTSSCSDPERVRTRAHDLFATSEEFLEASWASAAAGAATPLDLGAAAYRSLADVRAPRRSSSASRGGACSPFAADEAASRARTRRSSRRTPSRATAATRRARSPTSRAGWATAGASSLLTEGHGSAAAASSRCCGQEDVAARLDDTLDVDARARHRARHVRPASSAASSATSCDWPCSPRPT